MIPREEPTLHVKALGMVTPVGFSAAASCAAARAGINRLQDVDGPGFLDPMTGALEKNTGHILKGHTDGFSGLGRLVRLGVAGLSDLVVSSSPIDWRRTGLFLTISSDFHRRECARMVASAPEDAEVPDVPMPTEEDLAFQRGRYAELLLPLLTKHCGLVPPPDHQHLIFGDTTGTVTLLRTAAAALRQGGIRSAVIGAIDSLVEPELLVVLDHLGLLKNADNPAGILPGECAAFILVEPSASAAGPRCTLEALAEATEPFHRHSGTPALGKALAGSLGRTLEQLPGGGARTGLVIGGLNGDAYRAQDFGHAIVRLRGGKLLADFQHWHPAIAFGEVGAASGLAAVCMAVTALRRGYAPSDIVLVWLADDIGARASLAVRYASSAPAPR